MDPINENVQQLSWSNQKTAPLLKSNHPQSELTWDWDELIY